MPDYGAMMADRAIRTVDRRLRTLYKQAEKELQETLEKFTAKFKARDVVMRKRLDAGEITEDEYKNWLGGQVFQQKQWKSKVENVQKVLADHNQQAASIVNDHKMTVFMENYNRGAYEVEKHVDVSFDLYNTEAVARLIERNPQALPKWKIDEEKDYVWNQRKVNNCITQGIIQGKSIDKIAKDMAKRLCSLNENKMRMFARTAMTQAQNAGRMEVMDRSEKMGIRIQKKWLATLDARTRDTHRRLDGQVRDKKDPFDSDLGPIMYPGDPSAALANICNCRCRLTYVYPDFADIIQQGKRRDNLNGMTYEEWKEGKRKNAR